MFIMTNDNSKIQKKARCAFTLTEVIIVLVIIAALALILVPNIMKAMPDDHSIKYKKAFYTIQEIVSDIANDPSVCQGMNYDSSTGIYTLPNTEEKRNRILTMCYNEETATGRNFGEEVCKRLNTNNDCAEATLHTPTGGNQLHSIALTTNGMRWSIPKSTIRNTSNLKSPKTIYVDVDGGDENPNSRDATKGWYRIQVDETGKVTAPNTWNDGESHTNKTEQQLLIGNPTD